MIQKTMVKKLLKEALKECIMILERNDLSYTEAKGQVQTY